MGTLASLAIEMTANSAQLVSEIKKVNGTLTGFEKKVSATAAIAKRSLVGILTVGATKAITENILAISGEFETLQASLSTVFGSEGMAALQFKRINEFASRTPYTIQEITEASIKMKSLGLDPSIKSLESMGNTASAMGKPLMQFTEAVADAVTNEFERLKEFGIKSKQEGDNVVFTFRGIQTEVKKEAAAIEEYLLNIGQTEFAGAIEKQANTLPGVMSTLGGAVDNLAVKFAEETGLASAVKESAKAMTEFINILASDISIDDQISSAQNKLKDLQERINQGSFFSEAGLIAAQQGISNLLGELENLREAKRNAAIEEKDLSLQQEIEREYALIEAQKQRASEEMKLAEEAELKRQEEEQKLNERIGLDVERLEERYQTEVEMLESKYAEENRLLEEARQKNLDTEINYEELKKRIKTKFDKEIAVARDKEDNEEILKAKQKGRQLLSDGAKYSKAVFNANKALALAEGAIKAKEAVLGAYAAGNKIGGPPVGAAFAALAGVVAAGQLKSIADSSFSGGSSTSGISTGVPGDGAIDADVTGVEEISQDSQRTKTVYINISGIDDDRLLSKDQVRKIIDEINEEADSNVRIVI